MPRYAAHERETPSKNRRGSGFTQKRCVLQSLLRNEIQRKNFISNLSESIPLSLMAILGSIIVCISFFLEWTVKREKEGK
jgi:hypothetical protein